MINGELGRILERVRQHSTARQAKWAAARARGRSSALGTAGTVVAGDRVFDLITGQEGEVVGGTTENIVVPTPAK